MFRDRIEKLSHLIELYHRSSTTVDEVKEKLHEPNFKEKAETLLIEIDTFSSVIINHTIKNQQLDLQFSNKLYEFNPKLFLKIFNTAIEKFYSQIGFTKILRIVDGVTYFAQAIEGYKTIYDQIKDNISDITEKSYTLREKLEKMTLMKDYPKLTETERCCINDMMEILEPYAILPKPAKIVRSGNWAEHYFHLGCVEKEFIDEKNKFYSLFRTEN